MSAFIALQIIKRAKISLTDGQAKYRGYFITTKLYEAYRADCETILITEGYADCIVTE